jgi:MoxR-like ATPase
MQYATRIAGATRNPGDIGLKELQPYIMFGASPRASINLILAGRALAYVRGRTYALPPDVLDVALDVLRHRLVLSYEALSDNVSSDDLLRRIIERIPVPVVPLHEHANFNNRASA